MRENIPLGIIILLCAILIVQPEICEAVNWALLVGVNSYPKLGEDFQLHYTVNDVIELEKLLTEKYRFQNIITLLDEQATLQAVINALSQLSDEKKVSKDDQILIYFSGHGQMIGRGVGYLLPHDADVELTELSNPAGYLRTCLPMNKLLLFSYLTPAKHVLLILDTCYSGLVIQQDVSSEENLGLEAVAGLSSRQVITACQSNEKGIERDGHGVLTGKLLQGLEQEFADLNRDGAITTTELASYLEGVILLSSQGRQRRGYGRFEDEGGEFIFQPGIPQGTSRDLKLVPKQSQKRMKPLQYAGVLPVSNVQATSQAEGQASADMVLVSAGEFLMGANDFDDTLPHYVDLDAFYMDRYLVTVGQYKQFLAATNYPHPPNWEEVRRYALTDAHPMVGVNWYDAMTYAKWLGKRLPTEAEWECAARGVLVAKQYPWGNSLLARNKANYASTGTTPVGNYSPNGYKLYDMAGNVWQWCQDKYEFNYYHRSAYKNPVAGELSSDYQTGKTLRVLRGGSWKDSDLHIARRFWADPSARRYDIGFRCAADANVMNRLNRK